ncbi:MAG: IclR family transcriptional regulator [Burkholderiales bacterium]
MSSLTRMLSVLDLFSREHTTLTAEQIGEALGLTRTTCYRYTRELGHAGLLVSDGGQFMLGPRIIELDHRIIESDPLLNAGRAVVSALATSLGATGLLSTSYDDRIINVFQHQGAMAPPSLSFGRGTTMPLFRSSTSKVILASMSRSRLKRLWKQHQQEPDCLALGSDWLSFWKALQLIKRQGYWTSLGELDTGLTGIAAPILFATGEVAGCMSLVFTADEFQLYETALLGARLLGAAAQVSKTLAKDFPRADHDVEPEAPAKRPARKQIKTLPVKRARALGKPKASSTARRRQS